VRKIIVSVHTTLDGYTEGANGELDWLQPLDEDGEADIASMLENEVDTILLGRVTYHGFSYFWPTAEGSFADLMNKTPKIVFARPGSITEVAWGDWGNVELINSDVKQRVQDLKAQKGKDMVTLGSANLVSSFLSLGLIDELRLQVHPVVLGAGKPLFQDIKERVGLELAQAKSYPTGSTLLTYRVKQ
jgi:dihydrofolate reductase